MHISSISAAAIFAKILANSNKKMKFDESLSAVLAQHPEK